MPSKNHGGRPRAGETPRNAFTEWMERAEIGSADLAEKLGIAQSSIYGIRDGRFKPGRELSLKIYEVTGIPVAYWSENP